MARFLTPASEIELDSFKTEINLSEYAANAGYQVVKQESSRSSVVMRNPGNDDKIIIARAVDGHWTYFSVRDATDRGSIIDFLQKRHGLNLGEVRTELRPWIGAQKPQVSQDLYQTTVQPIQKSREGVFQSYARMKELEDPLYLYERGIKPDTIADPRFKGMIRQDARRNVIFPHYDREGLSGYEMKNRGFTGFASGGQKAVWHSQVKASDNKLVLTESAIDALSYHQLHGDINTRYMSLAGQLSDHQRENILPSALSKMQAGSTIYLAFDNDVSGDTFAKAISDMAPDHVSTKRVVPDFGKDWNEFLQKAERVYIRQLKGFNPGLALAK